MTVKIDRRFYVYALFHDIEMLKPFYVGKGSFDRWEMHEKNLEKEKRCNWRKYEIIKKLISKIGFVPKRKLFDNLLESEAFEFEKATIKLYGRIDLKTGCLTNLNKGGLGCSHSSETIIKIKAARAKQVISEDTKQKQSLAWLGRKHKPETIIKMKLSAKGRIRTPQQIEKHRKAITGRKHTEATRAKMSATRRGKPLGIVRSAETRLKISLAMKRVLHDKQNRNASCYLI